MTMPRLGECYYALVLREEDKRSAPRYVRVEVSAPSAPPAPDGFSVHATVGGVVLAWDAGPERRYHVYRKTEGDNDFTKLTDEPTLGGEFEDWKAPLETESSYAITAVSTRGLEGPKTTPLSARPVPMPKDAVLDVSFTEAPESAVLLGGAKIVDGCLDLRDGGHLELPPRTDFSPLRGLTVECTLRFDEPTQMPVVVSHGAWRQSGWFLQLLGGKWRWHVAGVDCDGGGVEPGRWVTMTAVYDGTTAKLYQDGRLVAAREASTHLPWHGKLFVGQYSGGPGEPYQVKGRVKRLRVFRRALAADEIASGRK